MEFFFQVSMPGYQYDGFRKEVRRVAGKGMGIPPWKYWYYCVSRVYLLVALVLSALFFVLFLLGTVIGLTQESAVVRTPEFIGSAVLVVIIFFIMPVVMPLGVIIGAKTPDPLRQYLWPTEAPVVTATFFADFIQVDDPRVISQLRYPAIPAVLETDAAYYLFVGQEHMLMLRKGEFTQGDPELFRAFIAEKTGKPVEYVK